MRSFICLLTICFSLNSFAKPKAYKDMDDSFWATPKIVIDGKDIYHGFMGFKNVPEAMASDPKAKALAESYRSYRNWGTGLMFAGLFGALLYINSVDDYSKDFEPGIYWGIFSAGFIPGIVLLARSETKLVRAINQYNGVYETVEEVSWQITPSTKGLGLAIHF